MGGGYTHCILGKRVEEPLRPISKSKGMNPIDANTESGMRSDEYEDRPVEEQLLFVAKWMIRHGGIRKGRLSNRREGSLSARDVDRRCGRVPIPFTGRHCLH